MRGQELMSTSAPGSPFVWTSRVRFSDTDASTRIHYSAMFRHFEAAENEFLRAIGLPYTALGSQGLDFPRVHVECDFEAPLRYDDLIDVEVTAARVGTTSFTLAFRVMTAGRPAARGRITIVCIDHQTGRPHALPPALAAVLAEHRSPDGREATRDQGS
jgi:YbgC/YbaW family acyl-CoA thioester hydrolase